MIENQLIQDWEDQRTGNYAIKCDRCIKYRFYNIHDDDPIPVRCEVCEREFCRNCAEEQNTDEYDEYNYDIWTIIYCDICQIPMCKSHFAIICNICNISCCDHDLEDIKNGVITGHNHILECRHYDASPQ